jgi:hypothetical protein
MLIAARLDPIRFHPPRRRPEAETKPARARLRRAKAATGW